jgi:RimJ/RimL family protein N-acetyltransferase
MDDTTPAITTERLLLRPVAADDAARLAELANDFDVARMTTGIPHPYARADADAYLGRKLASDHSVDTAFAIQHPDDGFIGVLGFHPRPGTQAPEVGYWLGRPYWGRGYATEVAQAALDWAGRVWGKRFVVSGHFADNPASGRVLEKAGFLYTGVVEPQFSIARAGLTPTRMMVWLA